MVDRRPRFSTGSDDALRRALKFTAQEKDCIETKGSSAVGEHVEAIHELKNLRGHPWLSPFSD